MKTEKPNIYCRIFHG